MTTQPECSCYPGGFTGDTYEGPQPDCPVHGDRCTCAWVDPSLWTTHYGAVEPGSQREYDPECPEHGHPFKWCETCLMHVPVVDEFDDQIGFEEQAREVHVIALDCGHQVVTKA